MSEQKVEMEQVPLKSDTDTTAEGEKAPETPVTVEVTAKKGWWFSRKTKKPAATDVEAGAESEEKTEEPKKKQCWWSSGKKSDKQKTENFSLGLDLVQRDPKSINQAADLTFEDFFGEVESAHSFDCIWVLIARAFQFTGLMVYRILALIVGIPAAILVGILFAILLVLQTFICVPFGRLLTVPGNWFAAVWQWLIHALIDPLTTTIGLVFSQCSIRKYGFNTATTEPLV